MRRPLLFFGETDGNARLCLRIARSLRRMGHDENVFVDTSNLYGFRSGSTLFAGEGWRAVVFGARSGQGDLLPEALELLRNENPLAVIVPHEWDYAAAVLRVASKLGVASYEYQHGDYWPSSFEHGGAEESRFEPRRPLRLRERQRQLLREQTDVFRLGALAVVRRLRRAGGRDSDDSILNELRSEPLRQGYFFRADRMGVGGDYYRRRILELGVADDRIDVTGYLKTDELFDEAAPVDLTRFQLRSGAPFAAYLYAPVQDGRSVTCDPLDALAAACDAVRKLRPSWDVLVLNHPRTPAAIFDSLRATRPFVRVGDAGSDLWALCAAAGLVIGVASSTLTEALVSSTPILMQRYVTVEEAHTVPYEANAVVPVQHPLHLLEQMGRALNDREYVDSTLRNRAHVMRELLGPVDGKCGDRAARGVLEAIERRASST